jgi:hypothetical protein
MKTEVQGGTLIVSEKAQRGGEWKVRFQVFPAAAAGGRLTNRSSGRVRDKVPSSYSGVCAAQLNR